MRTPYDHPQLLEEWSALEQTLKNDYAMSDYAAHRKIAGIYGISRSTVYYYLKDGVLDKKRDYDRGYNLTRYENADQQTIEARHEYNKRYSQLKANFGDYLQELFSDDKPRTLEQVSKYIASETGISLRERTIENLIDRYEQKTGQQPLSQINGNNSLYVINRDFYSG
jgi:transposase